MPISVTCPSCSGRLRVGEKHAGNFIKCPACEATLQVPEAELAKAEAIPEAEFDSEFPAADPSPAAVPPVRKPPKKPPVRNQAVPPVRAPEPEEPADPFDFSAVDQRSSSGYSGGGSSYASSRGKSGGSDIGLRIMMGIGVACVVMGLGFVIALYNKGEDSKEVKQTMIDICVENGLSESEARQLVNKHHDRCFEQSYSIQPGRRTRAEFDADKYIRLMSEAIRQERMFSRTPGMR